MKLPARNVVVWKFPLQLVETQEIEVPEGALALHLALQGRTPTLWAGCDPSQPREKRRVILAGTGLTNPRLATAGYLGTVQLDGYVWHYFDDGPVA